MLTKKQVFEAEQFELECGRVIPIRLGYETYGTLSPEKDNCILVSHYFTSTSHAAGYYSEEDSIPGYWNDLIGPGKAIDTERYFVVACDNLCNIQVKNPNVVTTGPASIDPNTGKPYGLRFPVVSSLDLANSQKMLLESLGISHIKMAIGSSLGGMTDMQLAIHHPDFVDKYVGVVTSPYNGMAPSFQYPVWSAARGDKNFRDGDYYGGEEPMEAVVTLLKSLLLSAYSADFLEKFYPRDFKEEEPYHDLFAQTCYEKQLDKLARDMAVYFDLNSWIYSTRITMNHDIRHGFESLEDAVKNIKAKVLMISNKQDMIENWKSAKVMVDAINQTGGEASFLLLDDDWGHLAGMFKASLFADEVKAFLEK